LRMSSKGCGWTATPGPSPPPLPGVSNKHPTSWAPSAGAYSTADTAPCAASMVMRWPCRLAGFPALPAAAPGAPPAPCLPALPAPLTPRSRGSVVPARSLSDGSLSGAALPTAPSDAVARLLDDGSRRTAVRALAHGARPAVEPHMQACWTTLWTLGHLGSHAAVRGGRTGPPRSSRRSPPPCVSVTSYTLQQPASCVTRTMMEGWEVPPPGVQRERVRRLNDAALQMESSTAR
jgi:hypothetical protein